MCPWSLLEGLLPLPLPLLFRLLSLPCTPDKARCCTCRVLIFPVYVEKHKWSTDQYLWRHLSLFLLLFTNTSNVRMQMRGKPLQQVAVICQSGNYGSLWFSVLFCLCRIPFLSVLFCSLLFCFRSFHSVPFRFTLFRFNCVPLHYVTFWLLFLLSYLLFKLGLLVRFFISSFACYLLNYLIHSFFLSFVFLFLC